MLRRLFVLSFVALAAVSTLHAEDKKAESKTIVPEKVDLGRPVDFEKDIRDILDFNCVACHNEGVAESKLNVETASAMVKGGKRGTSVVPGDPDKSLLYLVASRQKTPHMPPLPNKVEANSLTPKELGLLRQWILEGAKGAEGGRGVTVNWQPIPSGMNAVYDVALSPWGERVAAGRTNQIHLFNIYSGEEIRLVDPNLGDVEIDGRKMYPNGAAHRDFVHALAFHPSGKMLASGGFRNVKLWEQAANVQSLKVPLGAVPASSAVHVEKGLVAFGTKDNKVQIRNLKDGAVLKTLEGHGAVVNGVAFTPDGTHVVSASEDKTIRIWLIESGATVRQIATPAPINDVILKLDGSQVISAHQDNIIRVWSFSKPEGEVPEGGEKPIKELKGHGGAVNDLCNMPDANQILSGGADNQARTWDLTKGTQIRAYNHGGPVVSVAARPDGKVILTGSSNNTAKLFNAADSKQVAELRGHVPSKRAEAIALEEQNLAKQLVTLADNAQKAADKNAKERADALKKATDGKANSEKAVNEQKPKSEEAQKKADAAKKAADDAAKKAEAAKTTDDAAKKKVPIAKTADDAARKKAADAKPIADAAQKKAMAAKTASDAAAKKATDAKAASDAAAKKATDARTAAEAAQKKADAAKAAADAARKASDGKPDDAGLKKAAEEAAKVLAAETDAARKATDAASAADAEAKKAAETLTAAQAEAKKAAETFAAAQAEAKKAADALAAAQAAAKKTAELLAAATAEAKKATDALNAANAAAKKATADVKAPTDEAKKQSDELKKREEALKSAIRSLELATKADAKAKTDLAAAKDKHAKSQEHQKARDEAVKKAQEATKAAEKPMLAVAFSTDGTRVATSTDDGTIHLWDGDKGQPIDTLVGAGGPVRLLQFIDGRQLLSAGDDQHAIVWDSNPDWQLVAQLGVTGDDPLDLAMSPFVFRVLSLAFSPDGTKLATGGGDPSRSGELMIWDVAKRAHIKTIEDAHSDTIFGLQFSRDGSLIVSGAADKFVKIHEVASGKHIKSFEGHTHHVLDVAWKADGSQLVSAGADNAIKVWNVQTGEQIRTISNYAKQVTSIRFMGVGGNIISCGGDKTVRFHTAQNGSNFRNFSGGTDFMYSADATRDEKVVVGAGEDGTIRVWNGANGQVIRNFEPPAPPENPQASVTN